MIEVRECRLGEQITLKKIKEISVNSALRHITRDRFLPNLYFPKGPNLRYVFANKCVYGDLEIYYGFMVCDLRDL